MPFAWLVVRWSERIQPGIPLDAWRPLSFYVWLPLDVLRDAHLTHTLALIDVTLVGLAVVGLFTRWTLSLATVLSLYLFGLLQNQGKIDHYHHVIWFMALLAVAPSAHFLSLDALRAAWHGADRGAIELPAPPGTALRALRFIWALFGLLYFAPGLAKLTKTLAVGWADPENLRAILWSAWFRRTLYGTSFEAPTWLAELPDWLFPLAGAGVIAFQLLFLPLVFVRACRPWLALAGLAFHRVSHYALGISFWFLTPAYAGLFDWAAIARWLRRRAGAPLVVIYDGDCALCRRAMALVRSLDLGDALEPVAAGDPRRRRDHPELSDEMLARDLYVVAGPETAGGYDAYLRIASRVVLLWPLALVMRVPPVARLGRRVYRHVADTRACAIAPTSAPAPRRARGGAWVEVVGIVLLVGEASVSGAERVSSMAGAPRGVVWWSAVHWPFDHYPTFTEKSDEDETIWEPRAVLADGVEARIGREAYQRAFGHAAKSQILIHDLLQIPDPGRRRERSLELLRTLWSRERPDVRARAVEVRAYVVTYRLRGRRPTIVTEHLLDRFTPAELRSESNLTGR